jgi:hypothetical protein
MVGGDTLSVASFVSCVLVCLTASLLSLVKAMVFPSPDHNQTLRLLTSVASEAVKRPKSENSARGQPPDAGYYNIKDIMLGYCPSPSSGEQKELDACLSRDPAQKEALVCASGSLRTPKGWVIAR